MLDAGEEMLDSPQLEDSMMLDQENGYSPFKEFGASALRTPLFIVARRPNDPAPTSQAQTS